MKHKVELDPSHAITQILGHKDVNWEYLLILLKFHLENCKFLITRQLEQLLFTIWIQVRY